MAGRNVDYDKRRREKFIAAGVCYRCGGVIEDGAHRSCAKCREKIRIANHKYKKVHPYLYGKSISASEAAEFEKMKPKKKKYELDELIRMAKERGISYGILVAQLEQKI